MLGNSYRYSDLEAAKGFPWVKLLPSFSMMLFGTRERKNRVIVILCWLASRGLLASDGVTAVAVVVPFEVPSRTILSPRQMALLG